MFFLFLFFSRARERKKRICRFACESTNQLLLFFFFLNKHRERICLFLKCCNLLIIINFRAKTRRWPSEQMRLYTLLTKHICSLTRCHQVSTHTHKILCRACCSFSMLICVRTQIETSTSLCSFLLLLLLTLNFDANWHLRSNGNWSRVFGAFFLNFSLLLILFFPFRA